MYLPPPQKIINEFSQITLERISLDSSATDALINVDLSLEKNFLDKINENKIKLKLFLINSSQLEQTILSDEQISFSRIDSILQNDGFFYTENNCTLTELKDKVVYKARFRYNFSVKEKPAEENKYLSIGAILYIHKNDYIQKLNISSEMVDESLICGELKIFKIFNESGLVDPTNFSKIFDYRFMGKSNLLTSELNKLLSVKPEIRKTNFLNTTKKYFSNLYFSKHKSYTRLFFNLNYDQLIYDNSLFKKYIKNLSSKEIKSNVSINHIKVLRRQKYNKIFGDTNIISIIGKNSNLEHKIYEKFSTFAVTDGKILSRRQYQYGIEINFTDKTFDFLKKIKNDINQLIKQSKQNLHIYYQLLNNDRQTLVKKKEIYFNNSRTIKKLDNDRQTLVNQIYFNNSSRLRSSNNDRQASINQGNNDKLIKLIDNVFISLKKINFNNLQEIDRIYGLYNNIFLDPFSSKANIEDMNLLISFMEKIAIFIERDIDTIKPTNFKYFHWFNQILSTDDLLYGYSFFQDDRENPTEFVTFSTLVNVFQDNKKHYNYESIAQSNLDYAYQTPTQVSIDGQITKLRIDRGIDFKYLFGKIKQYHSKKEVKDTINKNDTYIDNLIKYNVSIDNYDVQTQNPIQSLSIEKNKNIDLANLNIILSNNIKIKVNDNNFSYTPYQIKSFIKSYNQAVTVPVEKNKTRAGDISITDLYLTTPEKEIALNKQRKQTDPIINLDQTCKFLFYFDSVHVLQYFDEKRDNWGTLTNSVIKKLKNDEKLLCRLIKYDTSRHFQKDNFHNISLPLYGQYFIFRKDTPVTGFSFTPTASPEAISPQATQTVTAAATAFTLPTNQNFASTGFQQALTEKRGMSMIPFNPQTNNITRK